MVQDRIGIRSEVIVIGGGLAGLCAAMAACCAGRKVVMVSRGRVGRGGCSVRASGGFAAAIAPEDDPAFHYRDTWHGGYDVGDPELIRQMVREAPARLQQLAVEVEGFSRNEDRFLSCGAGGWRRQIISGDVEWARCHG